MGRLKCPECGSEYVMWRKDFRRYGCLACDAVGDHVPKPEKMRRKRRRK